MKKILFLTTANLTTNPRLLKEVRFFNLNFECHFLGFSFNNWSDKLDKRYHQELTDIRFAYLKATKAARMSWLVASFVSKLADKLHFLFPYNMLINAFGSDKRAFQLWRHLKCNRKKYDFLIAHNLGALYPAWRYACRKNIPFAFDIEDYHPGESVSRSVTRERIRREFLMKRILSEAVYISYASPLIGERSLELIGIDKVKRHLLINNVFQSGEFVSPTSKNGRFRLVWFSQHIDAGRGLEAMLEALDDFKDVVELHLIGNLREGFFSQFLSHRCYIHIHQPIAQTELHLKLSTFDVGLALENADQDMNRGICLTNKIWAYTQAGLYVLATNTAAQIKFMQDHSWAGALIDLKKLTDLKETIKTLIEKRSQIRDNAKKRYDNAQVLSWDMEGEKLNSILTNTLFGQE
ncbi:MAG: hypothetical protein AAF901_12175 [Bacteroidota bacterium]